MNRVGLNSGVWVLALLGGACLEAARAYDGTGGFLLVGTWKLKL